MPEPHPRKLGIDQSFDQNRDALVVADLDTGQIILWNTAAKRVFGYSAEEISNYSIETLFPGALQELRRVESVSHGESERVLSIQSQTTLALRARRKSGEGMPVELRLDAVNLPGHDGRCVLALIRARADSPDDDVDALWIERLQRITAGLAVALTPDQVADVIVSQGLAALGAIAGAVARLTDDETALVVIRSIGYPPAVIDPVRRIPLSAPLPIAEATRTGAPIWLETPDAVANRFPDVVAMPTIGRSKAWAAIPLVAYGRVLGALALSFASARAFDDHERTYILTLANLCAQAIERARLYEAEREARERAEMEERRFAFLASASATLGSSLDYETTLQLVADLAIPDLADWCTLYVLDENQRPRQVAIAARDPAKIELLRVLGRDYLPAPEKSRGSLLLRAIRTRQPQLIVEYTDELLQAIARDAEHLRIIRAMGARSRIAVPLIARGEVLGGLVLSTAESGRRYGPTDVHLAEELARRAAMAVDNAHLYRDAQAAITIRDEFLALAAHELKTPVTGIKLAAQLMMRLFDRSELDVVRLQRYVGAIVTGSNRLASLTDELLDVSRIRRGQLSLQVRDVNLAVLVQDVVSRFRAHLDHRYDLCVATPAAPTLVRADPVRLQQVLLNLLDNAVKYSPAGGPIRVLLEPAADRAILRIFDEGIGLPPEDQDTIFQPFSRAANATRQHLPGIGLGLHICRTIIEQHGGRLWAESAGENHGTTMILELPRSDRSR